MAEVPTITGDTPCVRCGYNLRGLTQTGACPECAAAVGESLRGDQLRFAAPAYVASLTRGARLVWWSTTLILIGIVVGLAMMALAMASKSAAVIGAFVVSGLYLLSPILGLAGWWLLSTPDPASAGEVLRGAKSRGVLRASLAILVAAMMVHFVGGMTGTPSAPSLGPPNAQDVMAMGVIAARWIAFAAWIGHLLAATYYVRHLAARIPDIQLGTRATQLLRTSVIVFVLFGGGATALYFLGRSAGPRAAGPPSGVSVASSCGIVVGVLVIASGYVSMTDRLKRSMVALQRPPDARVGDSARLSA